MVANSKGHPHHLTQGQHRLHKPSNWLPIFASCSYLLHVVRKV
jgi:hypothetical protein